MPFSPVKEEKAKETERIIRLYGDTVYRTAYANVRIKADADDVFQDVFLLYAKKDKVFESEEHRKYWIINVTLKICKKYSLNSYNLRKIPLDEINAMTDKMGEEAFEVTQSLKSLPEKYRVPLYLYYFEELKIREIAEITKEKENTVKSRLKRGKEKLKAILGGDYLEE